MEAVVVAERMPADVFVVREETALVTVESVVAGFVSVVEIGVYIGAVSAAAVPVGVGVVSVAQACPDHRRALHISAVAAEQMVVQSDSEVGNLAIQQILVFLVDIFVAVVAAAGVVAVVVVVAGAVVAAAAAAAAAAAGFVAEVVEGFAGTVVAVGTAELLVVGVGVLGTGPLAAVAVAVVAAVQELEPARIAESTQGQDSFRTCSPPCHC